MQLDDNYPRGNFRTFDRPGNVSEYNHGQTMRYQKRETTEKKAAISKIRESKSTPRYNTTTQISLSSNNYDEDEWQPWMQRPGRIQTEEKILDLKESYDGSYAVYKGTDPDDISPESFYTMRRNQMNPSESQERIEYDNAPSKYTIDP